MREEERWRWSRHALQVIGQVWEGALWGDGVRRRRVEVGGQQEVGGDGGQPAAVFTKGREEGAWGRRGLLLHVCCLILEPQGAAAGPPTRPTFPPRATANHTDALHCLDTLTSHGPVGVL